MENRTGSIVIAIFVAVALVLLFIPEISKLFGAGKKPPIVLDSPATKKSSIVSEEGELKENSEEIPDSESFSKVMNEIQEGEIELAPLSLGNQAKRKDENSASVPSKSITKKRKTTKPVDQDIEIESQNEDPSLDDVGEPPIPPKRLEEREQLRQLLKAPDVNWTILQNPKVKKPLEDALRDSRSLIKIISKRFPRSRFALLSYISALSSLLSKNVPDIDFKEMVQYIGVLDVRVTQSFIEEQIGRQEYLLWRAISVGAFVELAGSTNKFTYRPTFKADLVLTSLNLKITRNRQKKREFQIGLVGWVNSSEAKRVEIYKGRSLLKIVELAKPVQRNGIYAFRKFTFTNTDQNGNQPYTFRVVDDLGNMFQKSYSLVATPLRKFSIHDSGKVLIPEVPHSNQFEVPATNLDEVLLIGEKGSSFGITKRDLNTGEELGYNSFDRRIGRLKKF